MKRKTMIVNYILSISLILLVIIFVILLMSISRFVLSDFNPIGEHVINTQNLLDDIIDVETAATEGSRFKNYDESFLKVNSNGVQVSDISYRNVNSDKSIVTLFVNSEIGTIGNDIYFLYLDNVSKLERGEVIVYNDTSLRVGEFVSLKNEEEALIVDFTDETVRSIEANSITGRVFYRNVEE